jgi:pimeloyl-ACP methyl ester carboxylesterase
VESPGLGGSDNLTKRQKQSLKKDGSFVEIGRSLVDATIANYPAKLNSIKATGHSMGGWSAIGLARAASERGIPVTSLVAVDAPGFRDTYNLAPVAAGVRLLSGFAAEGKAFAHMPAGLDPSTRAAVQEGTRPHDNKKLASRMKRQGTLGFRLAKAQIMDDLRVVLQANPSLTAHIVEAGASKVTKPIKNQTQALLTDLEDNLHRAGIPHGHIEYTLLHGETHALDANPGRAAYIIEQGLKARRKI